MYCSLNKCQTCKLCICGCARVFVGLCVLCIPCLIPASGYGRTVGYDANIEVYRNDNATFLRVAWHEK